DRSNAIQFGGDQVCIGVDKQSDVLTGNGRTFLRDDYAILAAVVETGASVVAQIDTGRACASIDIEHSATGKGFGITRHIVAKISLSAYGVSIVFIPSVVAVN